MLKIDLTLQTKETLYQPFAALPVVRLPRRLTTQQIVTQAIRTHATGLICILPHCRPGDFDISPAPRAPLHRRTEHGREVEVVVLPMPRVWRRHLFIFSSSEERAHAWAAQRPSLERFPR